MVRITPRLLCVLALLSISGCARSSARALRYAALFGPEAQTVDVRGKLVPPEGACLSSAEAYLGSQALLVPAPLAPRVRGGMESILQSLHPAARRVLGRTRGVWLARIENAAAVFLTCQVDLDRATGGFVLIDAGRFSLDRPLRDAEVPTLYWRALAGDPPPALEGDDPLLRAPGSVDIPPEDHAARYLVLHELGHALSLYAGEFSLDRQDRMRIHDLDGFTGLSWELVAADRVLPGPDGHAETAVIPREDISPVAWGSLLDVLGVNADTLAPGYALARARRPSTAARAQDVCAAAPELLRAGFVTPTAARYPTEDFAEMFAHAILADEGKLRPSDRVPLLLPGCAPRDLASPYFSAGVAAKRAYVEGMVGLRPKPARAAGAGERAGAGAGAARGI